MTAAKWQRINITEADLTSSAIKITPYVTLLATGYILQYHLVKYAAWPEPFAWIAAAGAELTGLAIMATKTDRLRKGLPVARMDSSFRFYVVIVAIVNGVLGASYLMGFLAWGALLADLAMGLIAIPLFWMVADRHEIQAIEADADNVAAKVTADAAQKFADEQTALDNDNRRKIEAQNAETANALRLKEFEATEAAKKRAERVVKSTQPATTPPATQQQPAQPLPKRIDPAKLKAALVANPTETLPKLAQPFGVTSQAVGNYIRDHGGRDAIING